MATSKRRPVRKVTVVKDENYTPMEQLAIGLNEWYKALRKAGFPVDICMGFMLDKDSYPDWIMPKQNKILPVSPDEEEDDD